MSPRARTAWCLALSCALLAITASASARPRRVPARRIAPMPAQESREHLTVVTRTHGRWRPLAFDGHVHTSHSHDADHPTLDVMTLAERMDLEAIVITDHGSSSATLDLARYQGPVTALVGEELGGSFGHAVVWNIPDRRGIGAVSEQLDTLGPLVRSRGGVLVLAHPGWWIGRNQFDPRRWMQYDALRRGGIGEHIDALELWNQVYWQRSRELIDEWLGLLERGLYVPIVGNSDFHRVGSHTLGMPRNVFLCEEDASGALRQPVGECLLEAVRAGRLYVSDGPTVAWSVADRLPGDVVVAIPRTLVAVRMRAMAPDGGTLELYRGREVIETLPLSPGEIAEATWLVRVPDEDTFLRVEIQRTTPVPSRPAFSLVSNPVRLEVVPFRDEWRGPPERRVRAPLGFTLRDRERAIERAAQQRERRRARRRT